MRVVAWPASVRSAGRAMATPARLAAAIAIVALASAGCVGPGDFRCATHAQCGAGASCELDGHCSVADAGCPSRRRYVHGSGEEADRCVAASCGDNPIRALAAGSAHACLLRQDGAVLCWGRNDNGQLGDGTRTPRDLAVRVSGLGDAIAVAAGQRHSCAVRADRSVVCWGADDSGQLGDGGGPDRLLPTPVPGVSGAGSVVAGGSFSCAALGDGTARCWGDDSRGQLGDGGIATAVGQPNPVFALDGVRTLASHGEHVCAIRDDETLWCWGANESGQLGDGTRLDQPRPVRVPGLMAVIAVATGASHSCAVTRADGLFCWGDNSAGQIGSTAMGLVTAPSHVPVVTDPIAIAAGDAHSCAVRLGGAVFCWGRNDLGQLGDGTVDSAPLSVPVAAKSVANGATTIAGDAFSCVQTSDGAVFCWGDNRFGQLGIGGGTIRLRPASIDGLSQVVAAAAGAGHTCAVGSDVDGLTGVLCWGDNQAGQLGDNATRDRARPEPTRVAIDAVGLAAGDAHSCAVTGSGELDCWGRGAQGELGLGPDNLDDTHLPAQVPLGPGPGSGAAASVRAVAVAAGAAHSCVVTSAATLVCFGANADGQLGDGTTTDRSAPTPVLLDDGVVPTRVAAGAAHSCALDEAGAVWCWGRGADGELGDADVVSRDAPVAAALPAAARATAVTAGAAHSCALDEGGRVWCWGRGTEGELGTGQLTDALTPVAIPEISGARAVAAGGQHSCAVLADQTVACWGANDYGQLGDGTTQARAVPGAVSGIAHALAVFAGTLHSCALLDGGTLSCWGADVAGQLGDDVPLTVTAPALARVACD